MHFDLVQDVKPGKIDDCDVNSDCAILSEVMGNITFHRVLENAGCNP
jgi:hypothetical protein